MGITGSNGKSMSTLMFSSIFTYAGHKCGIIGTIVNRSSELEIKSINTTPESRDLQKYLRVMVDEGCTYCFLEVSASGIQQGRVDTSAFDTVIFNNISREHIDEFGGLDEYLLVKRSFIMANDGRAHVMLNLDDENIRKIGEELNNRYWSYGTGTAESTISAEGIDISIGYGRFTVRINDESLYDFMNLKDRGISEFEIELKVPRYHNISNSMSVILLALVHGISIKDIREGLSEYKGTERRFEMKNIVTDTPYWMTTLPTLEI